MNFVYGLKSVRTRTIEGEKSFKLFEAFLANYEYTIHTIITIIIIFSFLLKDSYTKLNFIKEKNDWKLDGVIFKFSK